MKGEIFVAKNLEVAYLLDFYGEMLTSKQRDFIDLYYNEDLSLSEIAENEGITRQGVRDAIKRAEVQLFDMESKLGLAAKFTKIKTGKYINAVTTDVLNYENVLTHKVGDLVKNITLVIMLIIFMSC